MQRRLSAAPRSVRGGGCVTGLEIHGAGDFVGCDPLAHSGVAPHYFEMDFTPAAGSALNRDSTASDGPATTDSEDRIP
jgi:hypothetical protein